MPQQEPVCRLGSTTEVPAPSAAAVVGAFVANVPEIGHEGLHRIVTRRESPERWADADLAPLGSTREEAVELAREVRRSIGPAYRRTLASARQPHARVRVGARARGAGRPATRRARSASTGGSSGDDGSGSGEPEPPSQGRPARRWAIYAVSRQGTVGHRAVILRLDAGSMWRAGS